MDAIMQGRTDYRKLINALEAEGIHYTAKLNDNDTISVLYFDDTVEDLFDWDSSHIATIHYDEDGTAYVCNSNLSKEECYELEQLKSRKHYISFEKLVKEIAV
jgi:hypothetical protein